MPGYTIWTGLPLPVAQRHDRWLRLPREIRRSGAQPVLSAP
jgi:hypothetical protein